MLEILHILIKLFFKLFAHPNYPEGAWQSGDWMGQTAGVPVRGWYCGDKYVGNPPGPLRLGKIQNLIAKIVR